MDDILPEENNDFVEEISLETRFIDEDDPTKIETPILSKTTRLNHEIVRQEVQKLFDYIHLEPENLELNLDKFKVENERGNNILYFEKGGKWFNLTRRDNGEFKTLEQVNKIFTKIFPLN